MDEESQVMIGGIKEKRFSRRQLLIFALIFGVIGGYFIWHSLAASSSYDQVILGDKPVAYWAMNNPTGSEIDLTGNGHSGTYKGGTPTLVPMLNGDRAADFNGSTEYMTVPSSASFSIPTTHKLTWEGWIRPDDLQFPTAANGYVDWMGKCQNYSPSCEWESRMYTSVNSQNRCNRLSAYVFNPGAGLGSGADWQPTCNLLQTGQWLHVVGEYQTDTTPSACNSAYPGTINIWVNGVEWNQSYHGNTGCMSQYNIKPQAGSSPLNIGVMALDYWFKGAVGKVAIYNYLLSQDQINSHFTAMTGAAPSGSCADTCTIPVPTQTNITDTTAPSVSITAPTGGATISGSQTITANATDNVAISKVEYYDGTTLIGSSTVAPYSYTWNTTSAADGSHSLTAKAYDTSNNSASSQAVTVTVSNAATADTSPPTTPSGLATTGQTTSSVSLTWKASTDNVGVAGYKVYRYGPTTNTATISGTSFTDTGLAAGTSYSYTVSAFDAAGNESPQSSVITVTTKSLVTTSTTGLQATLATSSNWDTGYCDTVYLKNNNTSTVNKWTVPFTISGHVTSLWDAKWSQSGSTVTISNLSWNGQIKAGQTYSGVGFCAAK